MDDNVECVNCGWTGSDTELVSSDGDTELAVFLTGKGHCITRTFNLCPECGSDDITQIEEGRQNVAC